MKFSICWFRADSTQEFDGRTFDSWTSANRQAIADVNYAPAKRKHYVIVDAATHEALFWGCNPDNPDAWIVAYQEELKKREALKARNTSQQI